MVGVAAGFFEERLGFGGQAFESLLFQVDEIFLLLGILDEVVELGNRGDDEFEPAVLDALQLGPPVVKTGIEGLRVSDPASAPVRIEKQGNETPALDLGRDSESGHFA